MRFWIAALMVAAGLAVMSQGETEAKSRKTCPTNNEIVLVQEVGRRCGLTLSGFVPPDTQIVIRYHGNITPIFERTVSHGYAITNLPDDFRMSICFYGPHLDDDQIHIVGKQVKSSSHCEGSGSTWVAGVKHLSVLP